MADAYARLPVAVLGEAAAVQPHAGRRAAPDVGHTQLAVGSLHDGVAAGRALLEVVDAHAVEAVQVVGPHDRLQALHVLRARGVARVLQALGHLVRVMVGDGLLDERVVRIAAVLQENPAPEPDAVRVALEHGEVGHDRDDLAAHLLVGGPARLAGDLRAAGEARCPLDAEEVVVPGGQLAHGVALAALADDLRDGAACGMPVLLLALQRLEHHVVGDEAGKALDHGLVLLVLPEAGDCAQERREDEARCYEGGDARQDPAQNGRSGRDGRREPSAESGLRCGGPRLGGLQGGARPGIVGRGPGLAQGAAAGSLSAGGGRSAGGLAAKAFPGPCQQGFRAGRAFCGTARPGNGPGFPGGALRLLCRDGIGVGGILHRGERVGLEPCPAPLPDVRSRPSCAVGAFGPGELVAVVELPDEAGRDGAPGPAGEPAFGHGGVGGAIGRSANVALTALGEGALVGPLERAAAPALEPGVAGLHRLRAGEALPAGVGPPTRHRPPPRPRRRRPQTLPRAWRSRRRACARRSHRAWC